MSRPRERVRRRHSLLLRMVAICVLIATASITATAWIASTNTSGSIQQQYSDDVQIGVKIYDTLLGYAATHSSWREAGDLVRALAAETGRDITVTTQDRRPLVASSGDATELPVNPLAVVNPLEVTGFPGTQGAGGIDPRVVGPFMLTDEEKTQTLGIAERAAACVNAGGYHAEVKIQTNGRAYVDTGDSKAAGAYLMDSCDYGRLSTSGPTERQAQKELSALMKDCTVRRGESGTSPYSVPVFQSANVTKKLSACEQSAYRELFAPYVASAALLFTSGSTISVPATGLSSDGVLRVALASLLILVLTVVVCVIAMNRVSRPVHELTVAARQVERGRRSARVRGRYRGEIGDLASAFNSMADQLESTEDRRRQMVSDIAHELRTPLGNIRGWLEAAQDGLAEPDADLIDSLLEEGLILQRLVEDLQDLALADSGKLAIHPEPVDGRDLLRQVARAHLPEAVTRGIAVHVRAPEQLELVADGRRLRQALGNLVSNAVRYTPPGGEVALGVRVVADAVVFEVSDTGVGIGADDLPHIFDRFWRAEKSRNRSDGGSGLGLAITQHLVAAHDGTIEVATVVGRGTTFTIRLPIRAQGMSGGLPGSSRSRVASAP